MGKKFFAATLLYVLATPFSTQAQAPPINVDSASKVFIDAFYKGYADEQKKTFGLQDFPPPEYSYRKRKPDERNIVGQYFPATETIVFIIGEENRPPRMDDAIDKHALEEVIYHELGHYYVHQRAKELWVSNDFTNFRFSSDTSAERAKFDLVSEGIAEYLSRHALSPDVRMPSDTVNYLGSLKDFSVKALQENPLLRYSAGYQFVRPILQADVIEGIDYLITHPVGIYTPCALVDYQRAALRALEKQAKAQHKIISKEKFRFDETTAQALCVVDFFPHVHDRSMDGDGNVIRDRFYPDRQR